MKERSVADHELREFTRGVSPIKDWGCEGGPKTSAGGAQGGERTGGWVDEGVVDGRGETGEEEGGVGFGEREGRGGVGVGVSR